MATIYRVGPRMAEPSSSFHSFIVCQTSSIDLAAHLPYHTLSHQGEISHETPKEPLKYDKYDYNYCFDCTCYQLNGHHILVTQKDWAKSLSLNNQGFRFYHYSAKQFFPIALLEIGQCLIFSAALSPGVSLNGVSDKLEIRENECYNFSSEYGLLSDMHFLNSFVRGYRGIGCYKKNQDGYQFVIAAEIYLFIRKFFGLPSKL